MQKQNPLCSCRNKATHICLIHSLYLCESDRFKHNCHVPTIEDFSRKVRTKKIHFVNKLKNLRTETQQNKQDLLTVNKIVINTLKTLGEKLKSSIDRLLARYTKDTTKLINTIVVDELEAIQKKLHQWEARRDYLRIGSFLETKPFGKLRKERREKHKQLKNTLQENDTIKDIRRTFNTYIEKIRKFKFPFEQNIKEGKKSVTRKGKHKRIKSAFFGDNNFFANISTIKTNEKKTDRGRSSNVVKKYDPFVFRTNVKNRVGGEISNYLTNEKNSLNMTPLESTFIKNVERGALGKIKASGFSDDSDSLNNLRFQDIQIFDARSDISSLKDDVLSIKEERENDVFLRIIDEMKKNIGNRVYFNKYNKKNISKDIDLFVRKFKAEQKKLNRKWLTE